MLTYNMDVEERSLWLRTTPGAAVLAQPFYCTEAGHFYGRSRFATARTDKESYILFYTVAAQIETGLTLHRMLALLAARLLAGDASRSNRALIEQATGYIRAHYAEPLSLDALLAQTPVSKSWFLRLFRQYTGTTPYNFLLSTRITRAKELLVLTDFAVSEIAHQVGFGDESNFSTRFTVMVGQSPQQYRKSAMQPR